MVWSGKRFWNVQKNQYFHHQINNKTWIITLTQHHLAGCLVTIYAKTSSGRNDFDYGYTEYRMVGTLLRGTNWYLKEQLLVWLYTKGVLTRCSLRRAWRSAQTKEASGLDSGGLIRTHHTHVYNGSEVRGEVQSCKDVSARAATGHPPARKNPTGVRNHRSTLRACPAFMLAPVCQGAGILHVRYKVAPSARLVHGQ